MQTHELTRRFGELTAVDHVNLAWRRYVAGVIGRLLDEEFLNLGRIRNLGVPFASLGDAGTFDGIFLTAIVAVLLAST